MNVIQGFFLWANICLLFACITTTIDFTANLTFFVLGSPFAIVIIIGLKDTRKSQLMKNVESIESAETFQRYINYYMTIVELKGSLSPNSYDYCVEEDRDAAMTLKGYVNHHSEFCVLEDCPLRNFKKQMIKEHKNEYGQFGPIFGSQVSAHSSLSFGKTQVTSLESPALLISQAKNLYANAIK